METHKLHWLRHQLQSVCLGPSFVGWIEEISTHPSIPPCLTESIQQRAARVL